MGARRFPHRRRSGVIGAFWAPYCGVCWCAGQVADTLCQLAAQEMAARHEQIGQRAGHEQAMSVLLQPAIAHLGKAEHPLDDPDRMFDPGPHFGLGTAIRCTETEATGTGTYCWLAPSIRAASSSSFGTVLK